MDVLTEDFKAVRSALRRMYPRCFGWAPCRSSASWTTLEHATGLALCTTAAELTGARFDWGEWAQGRRDTGDSSINRECAEALIAQWLGLDKQAAKASR